MKNIKPLNDNNKVITIEDIFMNNVYTLWCKRSGESRIAWGGLRCESTDMSLLYSFRCGRRPFYVLSTGIHTTFQLKRIFQATRRGCCFYVPISPYQYEIPGVKVILSHCYRSIYWLTDKMATHCGSNLSCGSKFIKVWMICRNRYTHWKITWLQK